MAKIYTLTEDQLEQIIKERTATCDVDKRRVISIRENKPFDLEKARKRQVNKDKAKEFFTILYDRQAADCIVENVITEYIKVFKKAPETFEEAWEGLSFRYTAGIVFKASSILYPNEKGC
ncbi:phage protein [Streptococcus agalactiae]|uniref:hypothetical protein n=1 Tax=Streptococcus agalactiae TaxID=1311 RepID=UPI0002E32FFE|nr:hypothetical protein [Streptococcus agalactiae]SUN02016.1 phage protein [Streptococcus agalactiae]